MERKLLNKLELQCGAANIYQLYGRDARELVRCMTSGGDKIEAVEMLAVRCVSINGRNLDLETLENLVFDDYIRLLKGIQANFILTEPKAS